jgi:O-antigen ligase
MLVCFAVFGIVQAAFLPDFAQLVYPDSRLYVDWDPQGHRLVSTVLEPNIAGGMLMIGLLVQVARVSTGARVAPARLLVLFLAFLLTLSRSAALGFLIGIAVIFIARGLSKRAQRLGVLAAALVDIASPVLVPYAIVHNKFSIGVGTSAGARLESWLFALQVIVDYPVFGVGFNAFKYAAASYGSTLIGGASYSSDGGLLFILAMTGVVGLTVYCAMLLQVFLGCQRAWRNKTLSPESRGIAIGTAAATVAVIVQSAFVNAILTTFIMQMLWVLWGLVFVMTRRRESAERRDVPRLVALAR